MKPVRSTLKLCGVLCLIAGAIWLLLPNGETLPASPRNREGANEVLLLAPVVRNNPPSLWSAPNLDAEVTNEELLQIARRLVEQDALRTLAWAQAQTDPTTRERLLFAAL